MRVETFSTVVIGSGVGGLCAAALLARVRGHRVLVVEQHYIAGGFSHTFKRKKWEWDVGLHYVGAMAEGEFPRRLCDFVSGGRLDWSNRSGPNDHISRTTPWDCAATVQLHAVRRPGGSRRPAAACSASVTQSMRAVPCRLQVAQTERMRSTKRLPASERVPNEPFRQRTAGLRSLSA